jgi:hypothetical protein
MVVACARRPKHTAAAASVIETVLNTLDVDMVVSVFRYINR